MGKTPIATLHYDDKNNLYVISDCLANVFDLQISLEVIGLLIRDCMDRGYMPEGYYLTYNELKDMLECPEDIPLQEWITRLLDCYNSKLKPTPQNNQF